MLLLPSAVEGPLLNLPVMLFAFNAGDRRIDNKFKAVGPSFARQKYVNYVFQLLLSAGSGHRIYDIE